MNPLNQPKLRFLHSPNTLTATKLDTFRRLSSDALKTSLQPGQPGALKVRPDGTVLDGHHRLSVLLERTEEINDLPREIIERES